MVLLLAVCSSEASTQRRNAVAYGGLSTVHLPAVAVAEASVLIHSIRGRKDETRQVRGPILRAIRDAGPATPLAGIIHESSGKVILCPPAKPALSLIEGSALGPAAPAAIDVYPKEVYLYILFRRCTREDTRGY